MGRIHSGSSDDNKSRNIFIALKEFTKNKFQYQILKIPLQAAQTQNTLKGLLKIRKEYLL